jgi:uncharacterized SAM-binding protein YcdF (DUF218 family)
MKKASDRRTKFLVALGVLLLILFLTYEHILLAVGDFLVVEDKLQPADIIHVICGPDHRTDYAIQLYHQGFGKSIFFTGGWCSTHKVYHGEHGKRRALQEGIPITAIYTDDHQVTSTYSEAVRLKEFISQGQVSIRSIIVVSDPHHMRRARWAYRRILGDGMDLKMAPVPFPSAAHRRLWWTDEGSRKMVKSEYLKFLYYIARYQYAWGPIKDWLAFLDRD